MNAAQDQLAPVAATARIDTLDLLRGVAICGILLMNIPIMGGIPALSNALTYPAGWNRDWIAFAVQSILFEGTMRGLFTLLFGAGMLLMLRRAEGPSGQVAPIDVWTRRCLILMALGIVQFALFFWPGEILWTYGCVGLALLAFRTVRPRMLLIWAAILLIGLAGWYAKEAHDQIASARVTATALAEQRVGRPLTEAQENAIEAIDETRRDRHAKPAEIAAEREERTNLVPLFWWSTDQWVEWNLGYENWPWVAETLAFMLIGMALYRWGVLTGDARGSTYLWLALMGYCGGIALRSFLFAWQAQTSFDPPPGTADAALAYFHAFEEQPSRLLITLGHVGLIVGLFRKGVFGRAWPVRAMGRMALTVYSLQSILTSILFYGFGYVGAFQFAALQAIAVGIWALTGFFAIWWLRYFDMGPAEWLLRAAAYGDRTRPLRKPAAIAAL
jgi:uncharacterized protein